MQTDMYFYSTYAMARLAGVPKDHANIIAQSAQFVDDSDGRHSEAHEDGGFLYAIATAHHSIVNKEEQGRICVPFHFLPGGEGTTLEEKLLCTEDSKIANEMFDRHIRHCLVDPAFRFQLLGISAHLYLDTFSHYGFSGIISEYNRIDKESIDFFNVETPEMAKYLAPASKDSCVQRIANYSSLPFLKWKFTFAKNRPSRGKVSFRDNAKTFREACKKLHEKFTCFVTKYYAYPTIIAFESFTADIEIILRFEGSKEARIEKWRAFFKENKSGIFDKDESNIEYDCKEWEDEKQKFHKRKYSHTAISENIYKFHQAAAIHKCYVLKELLPKHNIAIF